MTVNTPESEETDPSIAGGADAGGDLVETTGRTELPAGEETPPQIPGLEERVSQVETAVRRIEADVKEIKEKIQTVLDAIYGGPDAMKELQEKHYAQILKESPTEAPIVGAVEGTPPLTRIGSAKVILEKYMRRHSKGPEESSEEPQGG